MKKHPVMKEDGGGQAKWKWVIVVAVVLTLAAGAWLFALPKKQPPVQAKAPVRAKIQATAMPMAGTAPEASAPTEADTARKALEVEDGETDETSALTEADEETPPALSAGSADGVQTIAQETAAPSVAKPPAADEEAESKPAQTAVPAAVADTPVPAPKPMLATAPEPAARPLPPSREESPAPPPAPSVAAPAPYTIQVGAFRNKSNADGMFKVLGELGYNPFIFKLESEGKDPLYMVRFGGFSDRDEAAAALNAFKQKENMAAVVARSGQI